VGSYLDADVPLVLSALSLGTHVAFEERVAAAAEAGFAGIGLRAEDYWAAQESGLDDAAMGAILDRHGVAIAEVELLQDWAGADYRASADDSASADCGAAEPADPQGRRKEETILHVARAFGASHANAGVLEDVPGVSIPDAFAALCRRAGDVEIALEPFAFGPLTTVAAAWNVVRLAAAPNAGVLVDLWHWRRSGTMPDHLESVPPERVLAVQLADVHGLRMEPMRTEARHSRLAPGEGAGDVARVLTILRDYGVSPRVVAVEVMNDGLLAQGPRAAARALMAAARHVLAL